MISILDGNVLLEPHMGVLIAVSQSVFTRAEIKFTDRCALMEANTFIFHCIQGCWIERYEVGWNRVIAFVGISRLHQAWV
jgi:hypothetical protein